MKILKYICLFLLITNGINGALAGTITDTNNSYVFGSVTGTLNANNQDVINVRSMTGTSNIQYGVGLLQSYIGSNSYGSVQFGYRTAGTLTIATNCYASGQFETVANGGIVTIGNNSSGVLQLGGSSGGIITMGTNTYGAVQGGYVSGSMIIGDNANGAQQFGQVLSGYATNNAAGAMQLLNLTAGQVAYTTTNGTGSLLLGAGTASNKYCIVAGDSSVSHGDGSITGTKIYGDGSGVTNIQSINVVGEQSKTITFTNAAGAAVWQAQINAISKYIPFGQVITFQFQDQTNLLTQGLNWSGFYGGGSINIYGNTTEAGAATSHTNQIVQLIGTNGNINSIVCWNCSVGITIRNLRIISNSTNGNVGIRIQQCAIGICSIYYCSVFGNGATGGMAIDSYCSPNVFTQNNIVDNVQIGLRSANCGQLISNTNTNGTSGVQYGLYGSSGIIYRVATGQPSGTVQNTGSDGGGQVY